MRGQVDSFLSYGFASKWAEVDASQTGEKRSKINSDGDKTKKTLRDAVLNRGTRVPQVAMSQPRWQKLLKHPPTAPMKTLFKPYGSRCH